MTCGCGEMAQWEARQAGPGVEPGGGEGGQSLVGLRCPEGDGAGEARQRRTGLGVAGGAQRPEEKAGKRTAAHSRLDGQPPSSWSA